MLKSSDSGQNKNPSLFFSRTKFSLVLRTALVLVVYIVAFFILDWLTLNFESLPNVVAWYPPSGLSFALLLALGGGFAPILAITSFISNFFVYKVSAQVGPLIIWSIVVSVIYGLATVFLRRRVRFDPQLKNMRDVVWLIVTSASVSAILSVLAVHASVSSGILSLADQVIAIFTWWIGETVGVLIMTPFLLIYVMPSVKQFIDGTLNLSAKQKLFPPRPKNMVERAITLLIVLYLAYGVPALKPLEPIYLIAIPLIWISLDDGIKGASAGITIVSFATMGALWVFHVESNQGDDVQLLMLVLSIASLVMGMIRTEQLQAGKELGESEKRFRALIENSADAITLLDSNGVSVYDSPAAPGMLGYGPDELIGQNIFMLLHPDDLTYIQPLFQSLVEAPGTRLNSTFRIRHKNGSWRWIESVEQLWRIIAISLNAGRQKRRFDPALMNSRLSMNSRVPWQKPTNSMQFLIL